MRPPLRHLAKADLLDLALRFNRRRKQSSTNLRKRDARYMRTKTTPSSIRDLKIHEQTHLPSRGYPISIRRSQERRILRVSDV